MADLSNDDVQILAECHESGEVRALAWRLLTARERIAALEAEDARWTARIKLLEARIAKAQEVLGG